MNTGFETIYAPSTFIIGKEKSIHAEVWGISSGRLIFYEKMYQLDYREDPQLFIIGIARNGIEAIEKVQRLKPDIVTMDVEMPEMDGMTALKEIMRVCPVPVIVLSNQTDKDPETTFQAWSWELRIFI